MPTHLETKLQITSWDEQPYRELPDGSKFTQSRVEVGNDDLQASWEGLMYYAPDGTSSYVTMMRVTGRLGERSGSFVLHGSGSYDGTTASGTNTIVPGSGTGDLAGITGTVTSVSTHADYPYMPLILDYEVG